MDGILKNRIRNIIQLVIGRDLQPLQIVCSNAPRREPFGETLAPCHYRRAWYEASSREGLKYAPSAWANTIKERALQAPRRRLLIVNQRGVAKNKANFIPAEQRQLAAKPVGVPYVIRVYESDEFSSRVFQAKVTRGFRPRVWLIEN